MINSNIPFDEGKFNQVKEIFNEFKREYRNYKEQERMAKNYNDYKEYFDDIPKEVLLNTEINWLSIYKKYQNKLLDIVTNQSELANYVVDLAYNKHNGMYYIFAWMIAEEGIISNLRANKEENIYIPTETNNILDVEYLGKYYKLEKYDIII